MAGTRTRDLEMRWSILHPKWLGSNGFVSLSKDTQVEQPQDTKSKSTMCWKFKKINVRHNVNFYQQTQTDLYFIWFWSTVLISFYAMPLTVY